MEPQINITCCEKPRKDNGCCRWLVLAILVTLFAFTLGLIIGAALFGLILLALPAIIVLAIVLFILILIKIIMLICERRKC